MSHARPLGLTKINQQINPPRHTAAHRDTPRLIGMPWWQSRLPIAVAVATRPAMLGQLPEQGVCVGLLLPPLGEAHAEMQQLGAVWDCWMWCTRHLAVWWGVNM